MNESERTAVEAGVKSASAAWKAAFNSQNAAGCAAAYEADAVMVAQPFGTFRGRNEIQAFWQKCMDDGLATVDYTDVVIEVLDASQALLSASWTMNAAQGVITRELWVLQSDGTYRLKEDHFEARE